MCLSLADDVGRGMGSGGGTKHIVRLETREHHHFGHYYNSNSTPFRSATSSMGVHWSQDVGGLVMTQLDALRLESAAAL